MEFKHLIYTQDGGVGIITFNRPKSLTPFVLS